MEFTKEGYVPVQGGSVWYGICGTVTERPPLLVVHGGPGYPSDYLHPLAALSDERQVIFYDQLGCGRSGTVTDPQYWIIERFVDELRAVRNEMGIDSLHILGHSWGTMVLTDYLLTQPPGVRSAIFASSVISSPMWIADCNQYLDALPHNWGEILRAHDPEAAAHPEYEKAVLAYRTTHELRLTDEPEWIVAANAGMNKEQYHYMCGPAEYNATGLMRDYDRTGRLFEIQVPALFTCGTYDGATPATSAYYASQIGHGEVAVFENSSHMPHIEESAEYIQVVREFLRRND